MNQTFSPTALEGRRALVTGGARGIGEAIGRTLSSMGAELVIADVNLELAQALAEELQAGGAKAEAVTVDLRDREATLDFARSVGAVDVLVNNAAPTQSNSPFMETPDSEWELQFSVILWAPIVLVREFGQGMADRGRGSIVNILSTSARSPAAFVAPYAAAKAALEIVTKVTALELGPRGVRSNAIAPAFVPTERNRPVWDRVGFTEGAMQANPLGRLATPLDMASTVAWLVSDAASYVNGQVVTVDGGSSAGVFMAKP
ncbi:MAG TPA: SDR family oxidoreductase [Acidimicrobiales bacterium]|nr:SDR family oxidoreductase [Acidimicrobiales bacterium]